MRLPPSVFRHRVPRPGPWAVGLWLVCQTLWPQAQAQVAGEEPLALRGSPLLRDQIPAGQRSQLPTFMFSDFLTGRPDLDMVLQGQAEVRRGDTVIRADRIEYLQPRDLARAQGQVRMNRAGNVFEGPQLELKVDAFEGFFLQPRYQFLANDAHGQAERVDFLDDKRALIHNATFTTCKREPGPDWLPAWMLRASSLAIDNEDEMGHAEDATLSFQSVPLLSLPSMGFALSGNRRSGLLAPTFGVDNISGTELTVPYYWNIAPNRDATLYPTLMTKRGINWGGEFRYLEQGYTGHLRADYLPGDPLREKDRWGYSYLHQGVIQTGFAPVGALGLNLNLNRVSDDDHWRDFPRGTAARPGTAQRLLPSDGALTWARGVGQGLVTSTLRVQRWQAQQDVSQPIGLPYDRLPQLTARYAEFDRRGLDFAFDADYTQFEVDRRLLGAPDQPNAQRSVLQAQVSRPWLSAAGFITPKLQVHGANYQFDRPLADAGQRAAARAVPTFSLDSGLVFERNAGYFGRDFVQTLEPRLFYVNTPYVNQNYLPNYDSGANSFNFASIYAENAFVGHDRISDNNLLTAGLNSRLLDPRTGAETARFGVAQRYRFADQQITLPGGTPAKERFSDLLLGGAVNWDQRWVLDGVVQYNPTRERSERSTLGARYNPSPFRVVNTAYRFQRDYSEQLDLGWQWPLNDLWGDKGRDMGGYGQGAGRWYSVGRLNYSLRDQKMVDTILGFEYDAGCWLGRIVLERLQTGLLATNDRIMFQLEFVGFSRVGIDPLQTLKNNIPRYQQLRTDGVTPSRFSNYD